MPIDLMLPRASKKPVTPTTAFSLRSAKVVAGSSRSTLPALSWSCSACGRASTSTLRPTDSAVFGLTPPPTPPCFSPAMALWSCSASHGEKHRSEEHTSELQSPCNLVCRLLLEKKKKGILLHNLLESRHGALIT